MFAIKKRKQKTFFLRYRIPISDPTGHISGVSLMYPTPPPS
uniref:Uncharacterized protein n=1 Tax=Anguilla anguilla TaxID=7936 RepID=A0A0E9UZ53_ANGAN